MKKTGINITTVYPKFVDTKLVTDLANRIELRDRLAGRPINYYRFMASVRDVNTGFLANRVSVVENRFYSFTSNI